MLEPISLAVVSAPFIKALSEKFADALSKRIAITGQNAKDQFIGRMKVGFNQHLTTSYTRCLNYKTLLSTSTPQDITRDYVNLFLSRGAEQVRDDIFVNNIHEKKSLVIVGSAGSGKSMFMKFLTVRKTLQPDGKLPLFVDLRRANSITDFDLVTFIRTYCTNKTSNITPEQFALALTTGSFTLILDGFDEIDFDKQDQIQQQILELRHGYPDVTIVVSSRYDSRFGGWPSFHVYNVEPLTKDQCIRLITTFVYDSGVKSRFLRQVEDRLFESHQSFLSSPLLTTIMLLTFEGFAEIPTRLHVFYDQAFDTLFQRHDALKEQFQRKTFSNLSLEDFKTSFSVFCTMSYLNHQLSFKDDPLAKLSKQSLQYANDRGAIVPQPINSKGFIKDLQQSVCMLQPDGFEMTFVHRSFQEFFTAFFLINCDVKLMKMMLSKLEIRHNDTVIPMALEMSRERLEQEWVLPTVDKLETTFFGAEVIDSPALQVKRLFRKIEWYTPDPGEASNNYGMIIELEGETHSLIEVLSTCYSKLREGNLFVLFAGLPTPNLKKVLAEQEQSGSGNASTIKNFFKSSKKNTKKESRIRVEIMQEDDWWLRKIGVESCLIRFRQVLREIREDIETRQASRSLLFQDAANIFTE